MKRFPSLGQSLARCEFAVAILLTLVPDLLSRAENVVRPVTKFFWLETWAGTCDSAGTVTPSAV